MSAKLVLAALCLVTLTVAVAGFNSQAKSAPSFLETRLRRATAEPRCGKEFGNKKCSDLGKSGQCCSKFGYCGSKAFHCVTRFGCQSECDDKKDPGSEESSLAEPASVSVKSSSSQAEAEVNKRVRIKEVMNAVPLCKKCMHGSSSGANGGDAVPVPLMKMPAGSQPAAVPASAGSQPDVLPATQRPVSGAGPINAPVLGSAAAQAAPMGSLSFTSSVAPSPVPAPSSANLVSMIPQVSGSSFSSSSSPVMSGSSGLSSSATDPSLQSDIDMIKEITADATKKALQIVAEAEKAATRVRQTDCNGSGHGCKRRIAVMVSDSKPSKAVGLVPSDNDRFEMHERVMKLYGHE